MAEDRERPAPDWEQLCSRVSESKFGEWLKNSRFWMLEDAGKSRTECSNFGATSLSDFRIEVSAEWSKRLADSRREISPILDKMTAAVMGFHWPILRQDSSDSWRTL